jgi:peptidoglycan/xylan/chitin deacetylase (PgdA/CDA1 family)
VISLSEYVRLRHKKITIPPYTVIITVDDGYRDFYDVAFPLLRKYTLPATLFATTAFVNGDIWLWHDRLHYVLMETVVPEIDICLGDKPVTLSTSTKAEKSAAWQILSDYCVNAPEENKYYLIRSIEEKLNVNVPSIPPAEFAAATWSQLKEMSENGIVIGGHTVNHPVLSQVEPDKLRHELIDPKEIIAKHTGKVVETFCYPNGRDVDITPKVLEIVKTAGYLGGVQGSGLDFSNLYRLPRFGVTNDKLDFLWKLNGLEQS